MKKTMNILLVLLIAILFTGCAGNTLPDENTEKTEQSADSEARGEVKEEYSAEESDDEKYQESTEDKEAVMLLEEELKYNVSKQQESTEEKEAVIVVLSEEELARLRSVAEKYYTSINRNMLKFTQADPNSSFMREYEGYEADEVVLFEVIIENIEAKRYITIGSKDGWNNCSILNEGY